MPEITIGSNQVRSLVSCIATQYCNSKVRLHTFESQLVLAYHLCDDQAQVSRQKQQQKVTRLVTGAKTQRMQNVLC